MSVALLDVNVLIAIFDSDHKRHDLAHKWLAEQRRSGWATCPHTINGCIRILSNPAYLNVSATPADIARRLRGFCATHGHQFWPDSVNPLDDTLFRPAMICGHKNITDAYLLGLAVRNRGCLATFDRGIPLDAVIGALPAHLELIS